MKRFQFDKQMSSHSLGQIASIDAYGDEMRTSALLELARRFESDVRVEDGMVGLLRRLMRNKRVPMALRVDAMTLAVMEFVCSTVWTEAIDKSAGYPWSGSFRCRRDPAPCKPRAAK